MEPQMALLYGLYALGAVATGLLLQSCGLGRTIGACSVLFYAVVAAMIATGNSGVDPGVAEAAGSNFQQRCFEGILVALVAIIVADFVRHQLRQFRRDQAAPGAGSAPADAQEAEHAAAAHIRPALAPQRSQVMLFGQAMQFGAAGVCSRSSSSSSANQQAVSIVRHAGIIELDKRLAGSRSSSSDAIAASRSSMARISSELERVRQRRGLGLPLIADGGCSEPRLSRPVEQQECWRSLPDAVFAEIVQRVAPADLGSMRAVCVHWFDSSKRCVMRLRPSHLPARDLVADFPSVKVLDLSTCTKDISPHKLRHLRALAVLEELTLGCHHRLIASTVTDTCLAELVAMTNLRSLNLGQCVHVGDAGMMSLVYLPGLRSLNISGCVAVTDIGIMMVAQLTGLTSLEMPWCLKVTNVGLQALTPLTQLATLNISGCQLVSEQGVCCLAAFTNLEKLSLLNLGYNKVCVTDAALARLSGLTKLRSLNIGSMQLCNKMVTDEGMRLISSNYRQLTQLGLMSLDISDTGVAMLARLNSLQALNLRGCMRVSGGCLKFLSTLTQVTDLCLLHNPLLEVDDACLSSLAKLPNLQILGLGNFQVPGPNRASDTCLVPLSNSRQLLVLSIAFFAGRFGPETCCMISQMTSLQHLDLQGSQHANADLLQSVGQLTALQSLHLSRCRLIDDAALRHISGLSALHTLNISHCLRVTDVGLAAVTKLQNLTHLLAQECKDVTDVGVAHLGRLTRLKVLDLSLCERVTGCGFQAFSRCTQMATLSLNGCSSLNDGGLRAIGQIVSLTKLDLGNCQLLSDTGISYLRCLGELTGLDLAQCIRIGDAALAAIASSMRQLATLKVNGCVRITDAGVSEVCSLTSLLTLHLDRCVHLTDHGLNSLTRLTGLTSLRISRCPNVTDAGVAALCRLSRLSTLSLAQCPRVTDVGLMALAPLTTLASLEF